MTPGYPYQDPSTHTTRNLSQGFPTSSQARSQAHSGQVWLNSLRPASGLLGRRESSSLEKFLKPSSNLQGHCQGTVTAPFVFCQPHPLSGCLGTSCF